MRIDLDGNVDCTNDGDNDDYETGKVTDRCVFNVDNLERAELSIAASARRYRDVISVDTVFSDDTFRRVVVRYDSHDVIYDLHKRA